MADKVHRKHFWIRLGVSVFVYWAILAAFYQYFYRVPAGESPRAFYKDFPIGDTSIDVDRLKKVLWEGQGTEFEKMAVGSAFLRYKIDPERVFRNYMQSYEQGWWEIPNADVWENAFREFQQEWDKKRSLHIQYKISKGELSLKKNARQQIVLEFSNTTTPMIGSGLELVVEVPSVEIVKVPADVLMTMNGMEQPLHKLVKWEQPREEPDGKIVAKLNLDFSLDPEWFRTEQFLKQIMVTGQDVSAWKIRSISFRD